MNPLPGSIRAWLLASAGVLLGQGLLMHDAVAGPKGGKVAAGQGRISTPDAKTTRVQQQSHSLAINWQTFNVKSDERVQFNQPSSSATVLNRVLNQSPSQIFGSVRANGQVFILNAGGVVIGEGARVNVGGLFVSSLDITDGDFMSGNYTFSAKDGETPGDIVNRGLIQAATGGSVTLVGGRVANEGVIVADTGHVNLAAGRTATVDFNGDGLVRFEVDGDVLSNASGAQAAVSNAGEIRADGGRVLLSAKTASQVFDRAVNNSGLIRAGGISRAGGKVTLTGFGGGVTNTGTVDASGTSGGTVRLVSDAVTEQHGTVSADGVGGRGGVVHLASLNTTFVAGDSVTSASSDAAAGGVVQVLGDRVAVHGNAKVQASGASAGGTVQVGGGLQGADPSVANATAAFIGPDAVVSADALVLGDGGTIIVWSEQVSRVHGTLTARAGGQGGAGGLIETSSRRQLDVSEIRIDASADAGAGGRWLLDPFNVTIVSTMDNQVSGSPDFTPDASGATVFNGTINTVLAGGADVSITTAETGGGGTEPGNVVQNSDAPITNTAGGARMLRIFARGDVNLSGGISGSDGNALSVVIDANDADDTGGSQGTPTAAADGDVTLDTNDILTFGGDFSVVSGTDFLSTGITIDTTTPDGTGGSVNIATAGAITAGNIDTSGNTTTADTQGFAAGTVTLNAGGGDVTIADLTAAGSAGLGAQAAVDGVGGLVSLTGASIVLGGNIDSSGGDTAAGGTLDLNAPVRLTGNRSLSTGSAGGNITFASTLDADAAASMRTLGITAGGGTITFSGDLGATERLGDVTINTAGDVDVDAAFNATMLTQSAGTGTTRVDGAMDITNDLSITADTITIQGDVTAGGDITFASAGAIGGMGKVAGGVVSLSAAGGITLATRATHLDVQNTTTGDVVLTEDDDVALLTNFSNSAVGGALGLTTLDGSIDTGGVDISANNGAVTLDARDATNAKADVTVNGGSVDSGTGTVLIVGADDVLLNGDVIAANSVTVEADRGSSDTVADVDGAISGSGTLGATTLGLTAEEGIGTITAIDTDADEISAVTNTGGIDIAENDDVVLAALSTNGGDVTVVAGSDVAIGLITNPTGDVAVTSTSGGIDDASANPDTTIDINAVNIILEANGIGQMAHVDLDAATAVSLTTDTAGGDISVVDADNPLNLSEYTVSTTGASQDVSIQAGAINVDRNVLGNVTDNLFLIATAGGITDGGVTLTASDLTLDVSAAGGAAIGATGAGAIDTAVSGLLTALTDGGGGGIFINGTAGDLDIAGVDVGAGVGNIEITSVGDVSQTGPILGNLLILEAADGVVLTDAANDVTTLVADAGGVLTFTDANALVAGGGGNEVSGDGVTLNAGTTLTLADDVESSGNVVNLTSGGDLVATVGVVSGTTLTVNSGGIANLNNPAGHAVAALAGTSVGAMTMVSDAGLALGFVAGGDASVTTLAGNIPAGSIAANNLTLNAARGIGTASALQVDVPGTLSLTSNGSGPAGNITVTDVDAGTALATSRITTLATDGGTAQTIILADADGLTYDADRVMAGDTLRLGSAAVLAASAAIPVGSTLQFASSTSVQGGSNVSGGAGSAVFFGGAVTVDPGQDFTVSTPRSVFAGNITMRAGQTLNLNSPNVTQFVGSTTLITDNLNLGGGPGSIGGAGTLTILNASAQATDLVIGGTDRQFSSVNVAALNGFGGSLNIGGTRDTPPTANQLLNNITLTSPLNIGGNVFLVGAGDVTFDTNGINNGAINAGGTATVVALGSSTVAGSGKIVDTDDGVSATGTTPKVVTASTVELLAANRIGLEGTGGDNLNVQALTVSAAQAVEGEALVDRIGGKEVSTSVLPVQAIYASASTGFGVLAGLINTAFLSIGSTAELTTVSISTPKRAKDQIGFIDEGVFLLPPTFTSPERALLIPLLGDPDFPGDQRPEDPDDDAAWVAFFEDVVLEFIASRHPLAENASAAERAAAEALITAELQLVIAFYDAVRERERSMLAREESSREEDESAPADPDEQRPGEQPSGDAPADSQAPSASLPGSGAGAPGSSPLTLGHVGDPWSRGGVGIEPRGWRTGGDSWPVTFRAGG